MKTTNRNQSGEFAYAKIRGHIGKRAGSSGIDFTSGGTAASDITSLEVIGAGIADLGDGQGQLFIGAQNATNNSGGALVYGDVVVLDTDGTIITTTTAQDTRPVGVVQIGGADGESVYVVFSGVVAQVNCTAAVTAGNYGETSTTAGDATENATLRTGSFCQFLASSATPSAYLFGSPITSSVTGESTPFDHGAMGATETMDIADGTVHRATLTANCAITVQGFTVDEYLEAVIRLDQDGTGGWDVTWDADIVWIGDDQPDQAPSDVTWYVLFSDQGDGIIYGRKVWAEVTVEGLTTVETDTDLALKPDGTGGVEWGTASTVAALDDLTDVTITAAAAADRLRYNGSAWVNSNLHWEPMVTYDGIVMLDSAGNPHMHEVSH